MRITSVAGTALAVASVAGGAVLSPAAASTAPATKQRSEIRLNECEGGQSLVKPQKYVVACGDGNAVLADLEWRHWGWTIANAKGTMKLNDCKPYCAAGHFRSYPVLVSLSHVYRKGSNRHYTQLTYRYINEKPQALPRLTVVKLPR